MWNESINVDFNFNYSSILDRYTYDPLFTVEDETIRFGLKLDQETHVKVEFKDKEIIVYSNGTTKELVLEKVKHILNLDFNLDIVLEHFQTTNLKQLFNDYQGTTLCLDTDLYESLMRAIIHQQISMKAAYTITRKLIEKFGHTTNGIYFFPNADVIQQLKIEDLQSIGMNKSKASYLIHVAQLIHTNQLHLESMKDQTTEEIYNELIQIKGIGRWTIECFLLFGLGKKDLLLKEDLGLIKGVQAYFQFNEKPNKQTLEELSKQWHPYCTYATFYLWKFLGDYEKQKVK